MRIVSYRFGSAIIGGAIALLLVVATTGCKDKCQVVIPSADGTDPVIVWDFHLPDGSIVNPSLTQGSTVPVKGGGKVTLIVNVKDDEGVQDAQIWAADVTWQVDPNTGLVTSSGPALLGAPTTSNPDSGSPGQKGCSERLVQQDLIVSVADQGGVSFDVSAKGVNFGGKVIYTPIVHLNGVK
jgi:hypothetical protein